MRSGVKKLDRIGSLALALVAAASFASPARAVVYGPAGCGVGHMIVGSEAGFVQIVATCTNSTLANQTFGITSGTLGCDQSGTGKGSVKVFIETNREVLAKDIARGSGETIASLATLGGCTSDAALGAALQQRFDKIFPSVSVSDESVSENIVTIMENEGALGCTALHAD